MIVKLLILAFAATAAQARSMSRVEELNFNENGCPPDRSHYLLEHETDCDKFYYCEYGERWELPRDCAPGTHFKYEWQVCVHENIAGCTLVSTTTTTTPEPTTTPTTPEPTTTTTTPEPTTTTTTPEPTTTTTTPEPTTTTTTPEPTTTTTTPEPTTTTTTPEPTTTTTTPEPTTTTTTPEPTTTTTTPEPTTTTTTPEPTTTTTTPEPTTTTTTPEPTTTTTTPEPTTTTTTPEPTTTTTTPEPTTTTTTPESTTTTTTPAPTTTTTTTEAPITTPDYEDSIERLPNGCPADWSVHDLLPHETDCDKFYYCVFGQKVERNCGPGTHFNPTLQVCDWPENAGCQNNGGDGGNGNGNGSGEDSGNGKGSGENSGNGSSSNEDKLDNGCPADFDVHQLLPHETDCDKFYYCVFGEKIERNCSPGTHFNPILQVCDWPESAGCQNNGGDAGNGNGNGSGSSEDSGNGNGSDEGSGNGNGSDEDSGNGNSSNEDKLDNGCPADYDLLQLLPHETDCSKFYYCVFGEKVESSCASGTHFNPTIQECDWPENVGCSNGSGSGEDSGNGNGSGEDSGNGSGSGEDNGNGNGSGEDGGNGNVSDEDSGNGNVSDEDSGNGNGSDEDCGNGNGSDEDSGNGNGSDEDSGNGNGSNEDKLDNGCPADYDLQQLLPHETDCSKFYYCVFGEKVESSCASGTHFNPTIQECDWPENVGCSNGSGSGEDSGNGNGSGEDSGNGSGNGEDNGNGNGSGEDGGNGNGSDEDSGSGKPDCSDNCGHWPHDACNKFWRCKNGVAVLGVCSDGLLFNPDTETCDLSCNVNCVSKNVEATFVEGGMKFFVPWDKVDEGLKIIDRNIRKGSLI